MCVSHRGHCMVLSIPRRWIQIEVQFNDIAFHISPPDRFHRGRGWCRLKLWILMATARVHIFSKCIFRLNDAAHSRQGVQFKPKTLSQRDGLWFSMKSHFHWLVRAVKGDPWKCDLFGPIKDHRTPRSSSVTKMVDIPLTRELPERPAQCFTCQSTILSPFIMRVGSFTLQSWNLIWFKWALFYNSDRKTAQKS